MSVHESMAAVAAAVSSIAKKSSQGVNYTFRGIDDVMNALHQPLADHDLFLAPRVLDDWQLNMIPGTNDRLQSQALFRIAIDIYHKDGSMVTLGPGLAQSHDYGDKAVYQAQQNAIKYLLLTAFSIPTGDPDMDGRAADPVAAGRAGGSEATPSHVGSYVVAGKCPSCKSDVWDNNNDHETDSKKPRWRCKNKDCQGGAAKKNGNGNWGWASWDINPWEEGTPVRTDFDAAEPPYREDDPGRPF